MLAKPKDYISSCFVKQFLFLWKTIPLPLENNMSCLGLHCVFL